MKHAFKCAIVALLLLSAPTFAADKPAEAHGAADGAIPAWTVSTQAPAGWTADCCEYAKAIGVNMVLYAGDWTGEPNRVIVLNVWPAKLATLDGEWKDDQKHYLERDPAGKISPFDVHNAQLNCRGFFYHGSDRVDDLLAFCDPGKQAGSRFSWSMSLASNDPQRDALMADFRHAVEATVWIVGGK